MYLFDGNPGERLQGFPRQVEWIGRQLLSVVIEALRSAGPEHGRSRISTDWPAPAIDTAPRGEIFGSKAVFL